MMDFGTVSGKILTGNLLFAACCIVYLLWWSVAFRPDYTGPMLLKSILFLVTALFGIAALAVIIQGCLNADSPIRYIFIIGAGIAAYIVLLLLTSFLMRRQVTTELMLIVFWACMQICACDALYGAGVISRAAFLVMAVIVLIFAAAGMICYLKYYDLPPMTAFYDGMVPLILFAVCMIGEAVYLMVSK